MHSAGVHLPLWGRPSLTRQATYSTSLFASSSQIFLCVSVINRIAKPRLKKLSDQVDGGGFSVCSQHPSRKPTYIMKESMQGGSNTNPFAVASEVLRRGKGIVRFNTSGKGRSVTPKKTSLRSWIDDFFLCCTRGRRYRLGSISYPS